MEAELTALKEPGPPLVAAEFIAEKEENDGVLDKLEVFEEVLEEKEDLDDNEFERDLDIFNFGVGAEARNNLIKCLVFFLRIERK